MVGGVIRKVAVGCLIAMVAVMGMVLIGGAAVIGALLPSLPSQPSAVATHVATGRPCTDPIETQGYKPGPEAFEPNHTGIDFVCTGNRTIVAVLAGTVVIADGGPCPNTYGAGLLVFGCNVAVETTQNGRNLFARYGHRAQGSVDVKVGEEVASSEALGTEGESGFATGIHLHFEIDVGAASTADCINPVPYLDPSIIHCPCRS